MKKKHSIIILTIIVMLLLGACGNQKTVPEGRWISKAGEVIVVGSNNDVVIDDITGTYSIFDESNVLITLDTPLIKTSISASFSIENDALILTDLNDGDICTYFKQEVYDRAWTIYEAKETTASVSDSEFNAAVDLVEKVAMAPLMEKLPDIEIEYMSGPNVEIDGTICTAVWVYEILETHGTVMDIYAVDMKNGKIYLYDRVEQYTYYEYIPKFWDSNGTSILK